MRGKALRASEFFGGWVAAAGSSSHARSCRTRRNSSPRECFAAFLANPEEFVDYAGQATEFAVREFAKAGIQLASAIGGGATRGIQSSMDQTLAGYGIHGPALRYFGIGLSILVVVLSLIVIVGLPVRWLFRPFGWLVRRVVACRRVV